MDYCSGRTLDWVNQFNPALPLQSLINAVLNSTRCLYRALLFGGMKESAPGCNEIELQDTTAQAFEALLKYIYTGRINLLDLKEDVLLDVLGLAHQYGFVDLEGSISDYLRAILSIHNVCLIYDVASLYTLDALKETCYHFIEANAGDVMNSESFLSLSEVLEIINWTSQNNYHAQWFVAGCGRAVQQSISRN